MAQLNPSRYRRLTNTFEYGVSDALYLDTTNNEIVLAVDDRIVGKFPYTQTANQAMVSDGTDIEPTATSGALLGLTGSGKILVGNGTTAAEAAVSGDATLASTGALTVTDVTVGSDATGDMLYKSSATALARLAKGSGGQALRMNAAATAPEWGLNPSSKILVEDFNATATTEQVLNLTTAGNVFTGTGNAPHLLYSPTGNILGFAPRGAGQTAEPAIVANGLDVTGDTTNDEGYEIYSHMAGAHGRPFVIGRDAAFYFTCKFEIGDADGLDTLIVGFRRAQGPNAVSAYTSYTDYAGMGVNTAADPMAIKILTELNAGGTTATDTTQTLAQATAVQFKVLVSAAGVVTYQHDISVPGTLAAPTQTAAFTFDTGDMVVPFFFYLHDIAIANDIIIHKWEVGYQ